MASITPLDPWEACWAPYDETTYQAALGHVQPGDVVLDIGAGDLRLSRRMAAIARRVFAIERLPGLLAGHAALPPNLSVLCADARAIPWPTGITLAVLLMRHCTHFNTYVARLRHIGCRRLITNARWGMGVELVNLGHRQNWDAVKLGWYACLCGQTGFVPGPPAALTAALMEHIHQVESCPDCQGSQQGV